MVLCCLDACLVIVTGMVCGVECTRFSDAGYVLSCYSSWENYCYIEAR